MLRLSRRFAWVAAVGLSSLSLKRAFAEEEAGGEEVKRSWSFLKDRIPNFAGHWRIDQNRSQDNEMEAIMSRIGVPGYLTRMGRLTPSSMEVVQSKDGKLIKEHISQLGGLYKNKVELFTDNREVIGKHPLDGSTVRTRTRWEAMPRKELEPCNVDGDEVVCCVSYGEYDKYGHRHRVIRFLDDGGKTFHSFHTMYVQEDGKEQVLTAHRFLNKLNS